MAQRVCDLPKVTQQGSEWMSLDLHRASLMGWRGAVPRTSLRKEWKKSLPWAGVWQEVMCCPHSTTPPQ